MAEERQVVVARLAFLTAGGLGGGGLNIWNTGDAYTIILAGMHTAIPNPLIMTDAAATFAIDALIGLTINNITDGSSGVITANGANTVTCAGGLGGGGLNTWSTGDAYTIILAGTHTAIPDPLIMTDAAATFAVGALIGLTINNTTDGSSGVITDNDATTVTCGRYFMVDAAHPVPVTIAGAPGFISAKADIFNTALPAIGVDWLGADVAPTVSPSHLAIYVVVAVAGVLSVARTNGGVTVVEQLNQGVALTANVAYGFKVSWLTGDTINFQYSATGANILRLIANEELL